MNLENKKVLVTGGGGFIGSHLVEQLVKKNCHVVAFVHYNSFNRWGWLDTIDSSIIRNIEIVSGDIRDPYGVKKSMSGVAVVFHLAALIGIPYSYHSPDTYVDTNVKGTLNILQAARECAVERVIHTSTSEIYGTAQFVPITENHPVNPQSPYAATKSGADFLALTFYRSFNLPAVVIRPFNTYGPRQSARAVIPTIVSQIMSKHKKVSIGSLTPTRDLNFVLDTAEGFIKAAESENAVGEVINLGTGYDISIGDLAQKIGTIMNVTIDFDIDPNRLRPEKSEVERLCASNEKANHLLHWKPRFSLDDGLVQTIDWFRKPENIRHYKSSLYTI